MEHYGLIMQGQFVAETLPFLNEFTLDDIGRFVYISATDNYYFGTSNSWIEIGLTPTCIKYEHIDFGFEYNQINAKHIPFNDSFLIADNVQDALINLSYGKDSFKPNSIQSIHIVEKNIKPIHIDFGLTDEQISAKDIPIASLLTTDVISTQDSINKLEKNFVQIVRNKIKNWNYNYINKSYVGHMSTYPIVNKNIIVQCYDNDNVMIFPTKVTLDLYYNRVYIYQEKKIELNVIILG